MMTLAGTFGVLKIGRFTRREETGGCQVSVSSGNKTAVKMAMVQW